MDRLYESKTSPLLPFNHFLRRLLLHGLLVYSLVLVSLVGGMMGYVHFEQLTWLDAFLNAAMILGGMGPISIPVTKNGKLFAGIYALYSGLVFLIALGIVLAPVIHRLMHRFHIDEDDGSE